VSGGVGGGTGVGLKQPVVGQDPGDEIVCAGGSASFNAAATAAVGPSPTVQWQLSTDGGSSFADVPGATTTNYTFVTSTADNGHFFHAVFTNANGSTSSNPAILEVNAPPAITMNPSNAYLCSIPTVSFSVAASGGA